ncbi:MAG: homoserine dehydrogenase [Actinomycetes bacterium]|jgi:homoserine dehydrogenase|nr:MAG: homoserine dehydrogenase [Actinomycetota bacterium]
MATVGIGLAGAGNVGGALARRLIEDREAIREKTGLDLELRRVAVRDATRDRGIPASLITTDPLSLVADEGVDVVVELMGGTGVAAELVVSALRAGKPVVSANKELVAARGPELIGIAAGAGVPFLFEAAVGGGIPIIAPLMESLAGEPIRRVMGIVNGTTNYMLTAMSETGAGYASVLAEAQALGYAEADPTADVSGMDAASKAVILAGLAFGRWVSPSLVHREGIDRLTPEDFAAAARLGCTIKLLAVAEDTPGGVVVRVHPTMIPLSHPLASVRGATNAIYIEGAAVGQLLFSGPGAGGMPTATSVLGDTISAARAILAPSVGAPPLQVESADPGDFGSLETQWCLRIEVTDAPGVLSQIAGVFGSLGVSIKSVRQDGRGDSATLLIVTHAAPEAAQAKAHRELVGLSCVREVASAIRLEGDEG